MLLNILIGSSFDSMWNVFMCLMACSTSILTFAILLLLLTSAEAIWVVLCLPDGTIKNKLATHSSYRIKPLSVLMVQCFGNIPKNTDFSVSFLLLIHPVKAFETKVMLQFVATQTKYFTVLQCL